MSLNGVTEDQPFGDDNITFRVEGKIFLCLWLGTGKYNVDNDSLRFACKLTPERNEELRELYALGRQLCQPGPPSPHGPGRLHQHGETVLATLRELTRSL